MSVHGEVPRIMLVVLWISGCRCQLPLHGIHSSQRCFNVAGVPRMDLTGCHEDEAIVIHQAVQGVGDETDTCSYQRGDCVEPTTPETDAKLSEECMGRSKCRIVVGVAWMRSCNAYSRYNYVIYQCVPRNDILDICGVGNYGGKRTGFVASPDYPEPYPPYTQCSCNITTDPGQTILLRFMETSIHWSSGCEEDALVIADGSSVAPRCGHLSREHNFTTKTNHINIKFKSDRWQKHRGFLLLLEVFGQLSISCGNQHTTSTSLPSTSFSIPTTSVPRGDPPTSLPAVFRPGIFNNTANGSTETGTKSGTSAKTSQVPDLALVIVAILLLSTAVLGMTFLSFWLRRRRHKERISRLPDEKLASHQRGNSHSSDKSASTTSTCQMSPVSVRSEAMYSVNSSLPGSTVEDTERRPQPCRNGLTKKQKLKKKHKVRIAEGYHGGPEEANGLSDNLYI